MTIQPFAPGSYQARASGNQFVGLRAQLTDLQRQLATGQRSETFGGLGFERRTSLDFRARISTMENYGKAIEGADLRVKVMTQGLERLSKIVLDTKAHTLPPNFDLGADGRTTAQKFAEQDMKLAIDVLNQEVGGRYLFGGREVERPPLASYQAIMDGDATGTGLKAYITQYKLDFPGQNESQAAEAFFRGQVLSGPMTPMQWYRGETPGGSVAALDADPSQARATSPVQVDESQRVGTGAAAIEPAIRGVLAQLGALASQTFANTPAERQRYETLTQATRSALTPGLGQQKVQDIAAELGTSAAAMKDAAERHRSTESLLVGTLETIENPTPEEVAAQILALQPRLQASYQVTSRLASLSLVNYL